jgi:chorismate synthase
VLFWATVSCRGIAVACFVVRAAIDEVRKRGDSCGGVVTCVVRRCPKGLGNPVFGKLEAELAGALMSLPATKVGQQGRLALLQ